MTESRASFHFCLTTLLLLHYDSACWYGLLGHAYMLVEVQSHLLVLTLRGWWPSYTIHF